MYHNILDTDHSFGMIFATVSVPLTDWWGGSHAIRKQKLQLKAAEYTRQDTNEKLLLQMQKLWNELEERFGRLRNSSRKIRDFRRLVLGGAEDQSFDAQGRIRLSRAHVEYAGLEHDAVVVGQGDKFEIWDQARFKALLSQDFDDVADELAESGIDFSF